MRSDRRLTKYRVIDGQPCSPHHEGNEPDYVLRVNGEITHWNILDYDDPANADVREAWENIPQWACTRCSYTTNDKTDISGCKVKMWGSNQYVHSFENNRSDGLYTLVKRKCGECKGERGRWNPTTRTWLAPPCPVCVNNETPGYVNVFVSAKPDTAEPERCEDDNRE